jgi:putative hemolysin
MKSISLIGLSGLLSLIVGCSGATQQPGDPETDAAPNPPAQPDAAPLPVPPVPECTPLAQPTGSENPASVYCTALGYHLDGSSCAFPDGTTCEEWSFFRGECGQTHSFCNLHGGSVSNKIQNMGTWTANYALCTLANGKSCQEDTFAATCRCE